MKNASTTAKKPAAIDANDERYEAPTPADLHAMKMMERDVAEGRMVTDAQLTRILRAARQRGLRERGASK